MGIKAAELPIDGNGNVYHLGLQPEELADKIIFVGDPARVGFFSQRFDHIEVKKENREIHTHTGLWKGKRISIISTGMGTDNIDIVFNELDALANIDLKARKPKERHHTLEIVRIGTCGMLQENLPMHSFIAGRLCIGMDCLMHFYPYQERHPELLEDFRRHCQWQLPLTPYTGECDEDLLQRVAANYTQGITVTAPGFYGPQCRKLRLPLAQGDFVQRLLDRSFQGIPYTNLEMETAGIYGMGRALGHKTLSLNVGVANRATGEFSKGHNDALMQLFEEVVSKF